MLVRDLMTASPVTVTRRTRAKAALSVMAEQGITALPVVTPRGVIDGIISEADLLRDRVAADRRRHEIPWQDSADDVPRFVEEVMTPHALTIDADADVADAVEVFTTSAIKSLPVVDGSGLVTGIISRSDVVRALARADDELAAEVDDLLVRAGLRDWYVEARDGDLRITGSGPERQARLARALARTVAGVSGVHVETDRGSGSVVPLARRDLAEGGRP